MTPCTPGEHVAAAPLSNRSPITQKPFFAYEFNYLAMNAYQESHP